MGYSHVNWIHLARDKAQ